VGLSVVVHLSDVHDAQVQAQAQAQVQVSIVHSKTCSCRTVPSQEPVQPVVDA